MIPKSQWTIQPRNTLVFVFAYPDNSLTFECDTWLRRRFPWRNIAAVNVKGIIPARNKAVKKFLSTDARFTDAIFIDRDMRPGPMADPMLCLPHDIACCRYKTGDSSDIHWHLPNAFHLGLSRIRRKVFEKMTAPWFDMPLLKDGTGFELCECTNFHMHAERLGFTSCHAGWAEHEPSNSWAH